MQRNSGNTSKRPAGPAPKLVPHKRAAPLAHKIKLPSRPSTSVRNQQPAVSLPVAPTSLANLAQLSGISLMPVGQLAALAAAESTDTQAGPALLLSKHNKLPKSQLKQPYNMSTTQLSQLASSNATDLACTLASAPLGAPADHWQSSLVASTSTLANTFKQLSLPIPRLNQKSQIGRQPKAHPQKHSAHGNELTRPTTSTPRSTVKKGKSTGQAVKLAAQKQPIVGAFSRGSFNQLSGLNATKLDPAPSDVHLFSNVASLATSEPIANDLMMDDFYKATSQNSATSRDTFNSADIDIMPFNGLHQSDDDTNNISLIKLMAILNNPALTITAVNNNSDSANSRSNQSQAMPATIPQQPTTLTTFRDNYHPNLSPSKICIADNSRQVSVIVSPTDQSIQSQPSSSNNITLHNERQRSLEQQRPQKTTTTRIPQSAANIQQTLNNVSSQQSTQYLSSIADLSFDTIPRRFGQLASQKGAQSFTASSVTRKLNKMSHLLQQSSTSCPDDHQRQTFAASSSSWVNETMRGTKSDKLRDPTLMSTSVRNLMMQDLPASLSKDSTVSAQLLRHIANQNQIDDNWSPSPADLSTSSEVSQKSILEPECILNVPRQVPKFDIGAKTMENLVMVTSNHRIKPSKRSQIQTRTSIRRMYIPDVNNDRQINGLGSLESIKIEEVPLGEVYVSEQHFVLDRMSQRNRKYRKEVLMDDPDEIFVNRSKRVMSKIDTMIERKKKRRFERISGREAKKTSSLEEQYAESEEEWSLDEQNMDLERASVIKTQLPLEELDTEEKRDHMLSVGLVSRQQKSKILVEQCERRCKIFTPVTQVVAEPQVDFVRFVDTMLKTGGIDVQLRTETSIKRNELPLIEGLNRNTSRLKMSYMNTLGLEKRSKRTTLYKVKPGPDSASVAINKAADLNKNISSIQNMDKPKVVEAEVAKNLLLIHDRSMKINNQIVLPKIATYCRDIIKPPNKNDYMKSLGLMAS